MCLFPFVIRLTVLLSMVLVSMVLDWHIIRGSEKKIEALN